MTAVPFEVGQGSVDFGGGRHHGHGGWDTKDAVWNAASRSDAASAVETRDLAKGQSDGAAVTGDRIGNVSRELCGGFKDTAKNTCDIEKSIASASYAGATATQLWGQTNQNNTTAGFAAVQLAVAVANAAQLTEAVKNAAATALAVHVAKDALAVEAVRNAGASALTAAVNQAANLAAIAECCCEQKMLAMANLSLVLADGQKTRDLINSNTIAAQAARIVLLERTAAVAA